MREINWNIFKAKFNGKERSSFENLAYQLFCAENNNRIGIFRFKNQSGIETEPIQIETELIGFQAKYYETKMSDNKNDIIDSIKKAKRENPTLSKILFYLNQEFSESSTIEKKNPVYKTEMESEAQKLKLIVDWRVPSHFERQLALSENQYLADFFFYDGKNIIDFIGELKAHSENLFRSIQTDILFKGDTIKIDRSQIIRKLNDTLNSPKAIILSGEGGCGKTAIIKEFYQRNGCSLPFYTFKAIEFNIQEIKSLLKNYGDYSLNEFINAHEKEPQKIVVIDSAERISDLDNQEPFKEFFAALLNSSWTIIFTTRLSYLDDLRFQFLSVYRQPFEHININNLSTAELEALSNKHSFLLPSNSKMNGIILNPFYLDEYLRNYDSYNSSIQYKQFIDTIWLRKIQNSSFSKSNINIQREKCFLNIIKNRSEQGSFYVNPSNCKEDILSLLLKDDIIGHDKNSGGYFITHDIYEEWGLDILIERTFNSVRENNEFLSKIGTSLIVRRAFRKWLSDKLFEDAESIKPFIEEAFENESIDPFWKDEILISVLLSDYSEKFFIRFKEKIVSKDFAVLKKIIFLLRISCKSVDDSLNKFLINSNDLNLNYVFTKPKGLGWDNTIRFIYERKDLFSPNDLVIILPLLIDWCNNNKRGETTRKAGLLALKFYQDIESDNKNYYNSKYKEQLIKIIIHTSIEIKNELSKLFDEVILLNKLSHKTPYYDLCQTITNSDLDNITIAIALPEYVLKFSELFWLDSNNKKDFYSSPGVEKFYGLIEYGNHDYFPASAFQTPIYWLLSFSFSKTVDFIIDFTNKTIKNYVDSGFDESIQEIELTISENQIHKQYLSHSLWNMYRGVGSPVSPYLLQSIHMALEKHLLEIAEKQDAKIIESWLIYLINKSNSVSITSVVSSIVLAFPNKFFNIAKILFSCSSLFLLDTLRARFGEHEAKSLYSIGYGLNYQNKRFEDERLKSCENHHRTNCLESQIVKYQFFRDKGTSEEDAEKQKQEIWQLIDILYTKLPIDTKDSDDNKTKRLLLARIDRRKMNPKVEVHDNNLIIDFNPHVEPDLEKHRNDAVRDTNERMKYSALNLWSIYKFDNSKKYGDYPQYEDNPKLVLKETKEIIDGFNNNNEEANYYLFNRSIPSYTSSALIREYTSELTQEDIQFCADVIVDYASAPFRPNYEYQISDGVEVAVNALPFLVELFPDKKNEYLLILFLTLFDSTPLGHYKRVCDYSIESISNKLWQVSTMDAKKILFSYLKFKPNLHLVIEDIKTTSVKNYGRHCYRQYDIIERFVNEYGNDIELFMSSPIQNIDISHYSVNDLEIAFQLIPYDVTDKGLIELVAKMTSIFARELLKDERKLDYLLKHRIYNRFSYFILFREINEVNKHIQPFVENFTINEEMATFFQELTFTEDKVVKYEQFWIVWESFYQKIQTAPFRKSYHSSEVIHNYLLAWNYWKETAISWHSIHEREKLFYQKVVRDIGHLPCVLDSTAKFLNEIGGSFLNEGIFWISEMTEKNKENELEVNTIYYIEKLVRKYIYLNRTKVRQDIKIKDKILVVLSFLIEHGSVNAYLLREDIL